MAIARETGANANSTAPVGTPDQVAETILSYVEAGATTILVRGFEPLRDTVQYGQELIPRVRQLVAQRQELVQA
jgi:alkanesulfonate monooxygenase